MDVQPPKGSHHGGVWECCISTVRKIKGALTRSRSLMMKTWQRYCVKGSRLWMGDRWLKSQMTREIRRPLHQTIYFYFAQDIRHHLDGIYSCRHWRQVQYLADIFWHRWIKEYLPSLQERQKWNRPWRNFAVNNIGLVAGLSCPRSCWPIGQILDVHRNSWDGYVRRVTAQTKGSILQWPMNKIVFIESAS